MEPAELFQKVKSLAEQGMTQKQIAVELGFKTPFTLNNRLIKASQQSGKPVPIFKASKKDGSSARVPCDSVCGFGNECNGYGREFQ